MQLKDRTKGKAADLSQISGRPQPAGRQTAQKKGLADYSRQTVYRIKISKQAAAHCSQTAARRQPDCTKERISGLLAADRIKISKQAAAHCSHTAGSRKP